METGASLSFSGILANLEIFGTSFKSAFDEIFMCSMFPVNKASVKIALSIESFTVAKLSGFSNYFFGDCAAPSNSILSRFYWCIKIVDISLFILITD